MCASIDKQALHSLIILSLDMLVSTRIHPQLLGPHMFAKIISPIGGTRTRDCDEMGGMACRCRHTPIPKCKLQKGWGSDFLMCVLHFFLLFWLLRLLPQGQFIRILTLAPRPSLIS
jgi:hypothetical protein